MPELDSDNRVGEVKCIRGKKLRLTVVGVQALRAEYNRTIEPARVLAAETLKLERPLNDLVNQAYGMTRAENGSNMENRAAAYAHPTTQCYS